MRVNNAKIRRLLEQGRVYDEGRKAYADGVDFYDNPYAGADVAPNWEDGWKDAEGRRDDHQGWAWVTVQDD